VFNASKLLNCGRGRATRRRATGSPSPTASNKAKTNTSISFDPEHQRFAQTSASGVTLYIAGSGVLAERSSEAAVHCYGNAPTRVRTYQVSNKGNWGSIVRLR
jgi:hypothetical protein